MYGKISTYISSVAGPFHPFGGAVDIIVVQQQDGSFKSTPWYVRFGKFQGVLKRSEEIVTVAVNGVEAGFHMHLDNTGQAYLLREVESDEEEDEDKSDSTDDEAVAASRRESFKSAESRGDVEEQDVDRLGDYGDDEEEANGIGASLDLDSLDGISMVRQGNGELLISFEELSSNLSDKQTRNGLLDANSNYSPNRIYKSNAREPNLEMELDNRVNLAFLPSGNVNTQQNASANTVQEELANGNEIQSVHSHLESSTVKNADTRLVKIDTISQTECLGRAPNSRWDSYNETSVFTMEESSGISIVSTSNTSGTDGFVLSGYSAYDYEHMDLPQASDVSDARKGDDVNSEVVLMTVDGHVMTAPISSFKLLENLSSCGHQMKTVTLQDVDSHSEDQIITLGEVDNSSNEYGTDSHNLELEHTEIINSSDTLVEGLATLKPEGIMQTQYGFSVSERLFQSEMDSKHTGHLSDSIDNQARTGTAEGHLKTKVGAQEMPRTESEIELGFNDEDIFKSCLALSELSPPTGEEEGQNSLSTHLEEEEEYNGETSHSDEIQTEYSLAQPGAPQVLHVESSHISDHMDKHNFEYLSGSVSDSPRKGSKRINISGLHIKGRGAQGQVAGSLPTMGFPSSIMETSVTEHVFSHSFDSSFCKRISSNDMLNSSFVNMEPDVLKEGKLQAAESSELYKLNDKDTSNTSLQTDVITDVEISLCGDLLSKGMGTEAAAQAFDSKRVLREEFMCSGAEIIKNEKLIVKIGGQYYPWSAVGHVILGKVAFNLEAPAELEGKISVEQIEIEAVRDNTSESNGSSSGGWRLWPFTFRRLKTPDKSTSEKSASKVELVADVEAPAQNARDKESDSTNALSSPPQKRRLPTITPTSEQLTSLNLKEGQNMITFTILTSIWGKQQVDARLYLWKWNTRIVISDVDGTITKSDVLGQVMPLVGKDWTQTGVARLFSAIKDNGYQLLFLSARAIVQAYLTRQFLLNLKQDGKALPDGPVLISPDGLFPSLYREVIRRAPHEFKIACLENIRRLFPPDCNPFYAGFGNRDTDEISYLKVGIPKGKIFIINPKGVVVVNHCVEVKSYTSLHKLADDMFPPMPSCEREDFNSWNYWKLPVPDIED